jgi:hypothetical protein
MIDQEIKEALKLKGETFSSLEIQLKGKNDNSIAAQMRRWTKRYNQVLKLIGYELTIKEIN